MPFLNRGAGATGHDPHSCSLTVGSASSSGRRSLLKRETTQNPLDVAAARPLPPPPPLKQAGLRVKPSQELPAVTVVENCVAQSEQVVHALSAASLPGSTDRMSTEVSTQLPASAPAASDSHAGTPRPLVKAPDTSARRSGAGIVVDECGCRRVRGDVVLPSSHLTAHLPFLMCCHEWAIDRSARDWNEEFQTLWSDMLGIQVRSGGYTERVRTLLSEYEAYCQELVHQFFAEGNWRGSLGGGDAADPRRALLPNGAGGSGLESPAPSDGATLAAMGCTRYGNVVLRVWRDAKLALNMQRCFSAFVETRTPWLFVPLTATFRHLHVCVSVQALIPTRSPAGSGGTGTGAGVRDLPVVYRGDGMPDSAVHEPTRQSLDFTVAALNLVGPGATAQAAAARDALPSPPPGGMARHDGDSVDSLHGGVGGAAARSCKRHSQRPSVSESRSPAMRRANKVVGVEVVDGLDERLYVVNPLGLVPPMTTPTQRAVPLRRWLHMVRNPPQRLGTRTCLLSQYQDDIDGAPSLLGLALNEAEPKRGKRLVEILHANGLNVCLLGRIAGAMLRTPKEEVSANHEPLLRLVATEMLARAVRRAMFQQMTLENSPGSVRAAGAYLTRTVASLIHPTPRQFVDGLMPLLSGMFLLDPEDDAHASSTGAARSGSEREMGVLGERRDSAVAHHPSLKSSRSPQHQRLAEASLPTSLSSAAEASPTLLGALLEAVLQEGTVPIVQRLCQLCGLQMLRGTVSAIDSPPSRHNYASLFTPPHEELTRSFFMQEAQTDGEGEEATANAEPSTHFTTCFVRPRRAESLWRTGRLRACLAELQGLIREASSLFQQHPFLHAHLWMAGAVVSAACRERRDALMLAEKACGMMNEVPARTPAESADVARRPRHAFFLHGQVMARIAQGHALCILNDLSAAEACFEKSLRHSDTLDAHEMPYAAHLRLEAIAGLLEVANAAAGVARAAEVDQKWEAERRSLPATQLGVHISEMLGSLLLERGAVALAAVRLWECFETAKQLRGERAYAVAEALNRAAFAYYSWDADRYGLYSNCMLRQAEDIMVETCGMFSPQHLCVIENLIVLLIRRERFVEASKLVHVIKTLPPRYALRVPRDHPVTIRLPEIEAKLREEFEPTAVVMIQRCWREYTNNMLVRAVCETSAKEIQRVGRGRMVRRELGAMRLLAFKRKLSEQVRQRRLEEMRLRQDIPVMLSFSKPILNASALFSKDCRGFNSEYQQARNFYMWWDVVEAAEQRAVLAGIEEEFIAAAQRSALAAHQDSTLAQPVLGCSTSFVVENIVFTRIARGDELAHLQNTLFTSTRQVPQRLVTAALTAIVDDPGSAETELFAEALIPLDRQPQFVMLSDGREGTQANVATRIAVNVMLQQYREAGLAPHGANACGDAADGEEGGAVRHATGDEWERWGIPLTIQGVEIVRGLDEQFYFTNMLGLVFRVIQGHMTTWAPPQSRLSAIAQSCADGKAKRTTEDLERVLISAESLCPILKSYTFLLLACVRHASGLDSPTTHKYFQAASTGLEEAGLYMDAIIANYNEARTAIRDDACRVAIPPLMRNFHLLRERIRLRPYFGSFLVIEAARWLLLASQAADRPFDDGALRMTLAAMENGEPSPALFTTCERFISHYRKVGEAATLEALQQLRQRRAQELSAAESQRYALRLKKKVEEALRRGGSESYRDCAVLLVTAIHLAEAKHDDTVLLASLLNLYAWLQTALNNLKQAQKSLAKAHRILLKADASSSPEMLMWRKNNRMLKNRLRDNAVRVIRRAVRQWKERRRLGKELQRTNPEEYLKLMDVQLGRRKNRLIVSEATQRVLVTEEEAEAWYQLGRQQRRGRNEAILRQTYGSRVQLFVDKVASAREAVMALAVGTKVALEQLYWAIHTPMQTSALLAGHRLARREVIVVWRADTTEMKLWHVEHVDQVIRIDFMTAYHHYLLRCVSAEERAWRRVIVKLQRKTKKKLGRYIHKSLRAKPKSAITDLRATIIQEEMARERIYELESDEFRRIDDNWAYGPEVQAEFSAGSLGDL